MHLLKVYVFSDTPGCWHKVHIPYMHNLTLSHLQTLYLKGKEFVNPKQNFIFSNKRVRDVNPMPASRGVLNNMIFEKCI